MKPAPTLARTSRMGTVKPWGLPRRAGSCDSERWVLAMQTGRLEKPLEEKRATDAKIHT